MSVRTRVFLVPAVVAVVAGAAACGGDPAGVDPIEELPRELTVEEQAVIASSNLFAFDLLERVHAADGESANVFLSPLSASMALGMAMNGADGETWSQMRDVLGFVDLEEQEINEAYQGLIELLLDLDPNVTFGLGNSVWAREGFPFHQSFYDRVTTHFDADLAELDFADPAAVETINGWVSDATNGRIDQLLESIPAGMIMYLVNAVYFNGSWASQFDPDRTRDRPFTLATGGEVMVPMMSRKGDFALFHTEDARGVQLPYGGGAFTAVAVLPNGTVDDLVAGLDADVWNDWMRMLDVAGGTEATVDLPRFELEYHRSLQDDLDALGMVDAFDAVAADFTRLTPADLPAGQGPPWVAITEVLQKTFLKVDEEGTEAAAATSVGIGLTSGPPTLTFDRPFLLAIRERLSGTILFIGVIGDPSR